MSDIQKTKEVIRFNGDIQTLKTLGYVHGKYFARNYIGYRLPDEVYDTEESMMVWKANKDIQFSVRKEEQKVLMFKNIVENKFTNIEEIRSTLEDYESSDGYHPICLYFKEDKFEFINFDTHYFVDELSTSRRILSKIEKKEELDEKDIRMIKRHSELQEEYKTYEKYDYFDGATSIIIEDNEIKAFLNLINNKLISIKNIEIS